VGVTYHVWSLEEIAGLANSQLRAAMNKDYVLFHLREAAEELDTSIHEMETDPEYEFGNFLVAMTHLYHHVNTAWNARDASQEQTDSCSDDDFRRWRQFPEDIDLST
jgi:hypothetical protein